MLRNPVYVQADLDVYEFFKSHRTVIVNDTADFTGMNVCYLYQGLDVKASKKNDLKDQMLVGKIKCRNCGYVLMSIVNRIGRQYLRCMKRLDNKSCPDCGKIITSEPERKEF